MSDKSLLEIRRALFLRGLARGLGARELHTFIDEGVRRAKRAATGDGNGGIKAAG